MTEGKRGRKKLIKRIGLGIVTAAWAASILLLAFLWIHSLGLQTVAAQENLTEAGEEAGAEEACTGETQTGEEKPDGIREAGHGAAPDRLDIPFPVDTKEWNYILVNGSTPLEEDFAPRLTRTRNGKLVDSRIKGPLEQMLDAAAEAGHRLVICSAYRDQEKQAGLLEARAAQLERSGMTSREARREAGRQLETPGSSEHHTGLAVDIVGADYQVLDEGQAMTQEARWLAGHCAEYGFILRYPEDKEEITGIDYESWHFRYVGKQAARFIQENRLCLEEFLEMAETQTGELD